MSKRTGQTDKSFLAFHFTLGLHAVLTPAQLTEVRKRNADRAAIGDTLSCATHDFVDANEVMSAAFVDAFEREPNLNDDSDLSLWNTAWTLAKAAGFRHPGLSAVLKQYGFKLTHTGGNCTAWVRDFTTIHGPKGAKERRDWLTVEGDPTAPTRMTDRVRVTYLEDDADGDNNERVLAEVVVDAEQLVKLVVQAHANYLNVPLTARLAGAL